MGYELRDGLEFMRSLPDQSVDGIFTDPPWGRGPQIVGQEIWIDLLRELDKEGGRVLRPGGRVLIWVGMRMFSDATKCFSKLQHNRQIYEKVSAGQKDTHHPCARPFITVKQILRDWFDEAEYVIDPFAGSDTTGVACRELNLKYDSSEIDPKMFMFGQQRHAELLPLEWGTSAK